ncbi:hypothetical protein C1H46_021318 [Malus baccata]|uniref:TF-B3 domain-containing protein n=1 Tax=Malus baccata TaxID=106549 RepID=A0A540M2T9_MALBA|nr:hypothetical protein C1H46_021318 [Malus baccata]
MENFNGRPPCKCTLRGPSGESWTVGLEGREDGKFFFRKGWQNFVEDHLLEIGNFLVFKYDGDTKFDVKIYNPTGCEKEEAVAAKKTTGNQASIRNQKKSMLYKPADVKETSDGLIAFRSKYKTCFKATVPKIPYRMILGKARHLSAIPNGLVTDDVPCILQTVPKKLAVAKGLIEKERVRLTDPNGKTWKVKLRVEEIKSCGSRLLMTEGLLKCWHANNISPGDTAVFELVNEKRSEMKIHFFRAEAGGKRPTVVLELDASDSVVEN